MNYMNIINNSDNYTRLKLTTESETTTITQTISLLTRKVNELNTELNNKITDLDKNMKDISDTIMTEIEYIKMNKNECTHCNNNKNKINDINTNEDPGVLKVDYATEQDLNNIKMEISKVKSYTLDIYNEVIKMRNVIDTCQAYKAITNDISNLKSEIIVNNSGYYDNDYFLYNSDEWIHTHTILKYLNI
jgi:hypothetical protein